MISDFRLLVFHTAATQLSFTRAAEILLITQPAVTKHIHELETHFNSRLFERRGNTIALTASGKTLLSYTSKLRQLYSAMEQDMSINSGVLKGVLQIGASTTIAQYILPGILAAFKQAYPQLKVQVYSGNTSQVEKDLIDGRIELGFIEGHSKHKQIKYTFFKEDELVLVGSAAQPLYTQKTISTKLLQQAQLVMREQGSGTLEVVRHAFKKAGIDWQELTIAAELDSSEAIKNYLLHTTCLAFLSRYCIQSNAASFPFKVYRVPGLNILRPLNAIYLHGGPSTFAAAFLKFALNYNLK